MHVPGRRTAMGVEHSDTGSYELIANTTHTRTKKSGQEEADIPVDLFCGHYNWVPGPGQVLMDLLPEIVHVPLGGTRGGVLGYPAPVGQLCDVMRGEARAAGPGSDAILDGMCDVLLAMALRHTKGLERAVWLAAAEGAVRIVTEAVLNDPGHDWSIEKFATLNSMSRATLIRRFTRETGMNPGDFLVRLRVLLASDLLTATDRPVNAIATAVGYASESAFGRAFRLATGSTPTQFRRSARDTPGADKVNNDLRYPTKLRILRPCSTWKTPRLRCALLRRHPLTGSNPSPQLRANAPYLITRRVTRLATGFAPTTRSW